MPNFSEGRNRQTVDRIAESITQVPTACVLDKHIDPDHNRSVITFVASHEHVVDAAFAAVSTAADLIDMRKHCGEHPRLGATDVLPFVPIEGTTMDECIKLAHQTGRRIADELSIPVYFYERAALRPERRNLEDVRRGAFELLREQILFNPDRAPDVGRPRIHETAGAIVVGARPFLIAFNVVLQSNDAAIARKIAHSVRAKGGGLPLLKALGFQLHSRDLAQVSMNLVDYQVTGMSAAYDAVKSEAERLGVGIHSAEIVGLVPRNALDRNAAYFEKLVDFSEAKVLEHQIEVCCR